MKAYVEAAGLRFRVSARIGWAILAVLLALMSVVLCFAFLQEERAGRLLATEAVTIDAVVTAKTKDKRQRKNRSMSYHLVLAFTPPGEDKVAIKTSVSRKVYDATKIGDRMPIRYARSQPKVFEIAAGERARAARWLGLLAAVTGPVAFGAAFWAGRQWESTAAVAEG
jgi:hypothetical protein